MNATDLRLYELLGNKTLSFGCVVTYKHYYSSVTGDSRFHIGIRSKIDMDDWKRFQTFRLSLKK